MLSHLTNTLLYLSCADLYMIELSHRCWRISNAKILLPMISMGNPHWCSNGRELYLCRSEICNAENKIGDMSLRMEKVAICITRISGISDCKFAGSASDFCVDSFANLHLIFFQWKKTLSEHSLNYNPYRAALQILQASELTTFSSDLLVQLLFRLTF